MGNRAVITTEDREIGVYLHWNGGRDSVEPLLKYCELQCYRAPETDTYGWARLCQVAGNFFGGSLSVGIHPYTTDEKEYPGDNGIYVIKNWKIVNRLRVKYTEDWGSVGIEEFPAEQEQREYNYQEALHAFDERMPEHCRLGELLDAIEKPRGELKIGDDVWLRSYAGWEHHKIIGIGKHPYKDVEMPYVGAFGRDGDYESNPNNYIKSDVVMVYAEA
jgi:hypothetical protein